MKDKHVYGMKYDIRMKTFDEDTVHDIKDFEITDYKDNKFISDYQDMEFCIKDAQYFIIYGNVFEDIIKQIAEENYQIGLKDSKTKKKVEEVTTEA